jgi:hypothetical protein
MNRKFVSSTIQPITLLIAVTRTGIEPLPPHGRLSPTLVTKATAFCRSKPKDMQQNNTSLVRVLASFLRGLFRSASPRDPLTSGKMRYQRPSAHCPTPGPTGSTLAALDLAGSAPRCRLRWRAAGRDSRWIGATRPVWQPTSPRSLTTESNASFGAGRYFTIRHRTWIN